MFAAERVGIGGAPARRVKSLLSLVVALMGCQTSMTIGEQQQAITAVGDMPDAGAADVADAEQAAIDDGELAPTYTYRGSGYASFCTGGPMGAGPFGMLVRFTGCNCSQLVKDCTDEDCTKCSGSRAEEPSKYVTTWLSPIQIPIVNMLPGCYAEELAQCDAYCRSKYPESCD